MTALLLLVQVCGERAWQSRGAVAYFAVDVVMCLTFVAVFALLIWQVCT